MSFQIFQRFPKWFGSNWSYPRVGRSGYTRNFPHLDGRAHGNSWCPHSCLVSPHVCCFSHFSLSLFLGFNWFNPNSHWFQPTFWMTSRTATAVAVQSRPQARNPWHRMACSMVLENLNLLISQQNNNMCRIYTYHTGYNFWWYMLLFINIVFPYVSLYIYIYVW